ncbi:MAG: helix-turn-helix domain-containing protein [Pleurocapsa sp.]
MAIIRYTFRLYPNKSQETELALNNISVA